MGVNDQRTLMITEVMGQMLQDINWGAFEHASHAAQLSLATVTILLPFCGECSHLIDDYYALTSASAVSL